MTNEELKKKIVEIIISAIWKDAEADYDSTDETEACSIADALIAAGIGDVEEAEHRAKVAERALKNAVDAYVGLECTCKGVYDNHFDSDEECEGCEWRRFEMEDAIPCAVNKYLNYAEKELAEEEEK